MQKEEEREEAQRKKAEGDDHPTAESKKMAGVEVTRLRRLRRTESIRSLLTENHVHASDLVAPLFVRDGENVREPVDIDAGVFRFSVDTVSVRSSGSSTRG